MVKRLIGYWSKPITIAPNIVSLYQNFMFPQSRDVCNIIRGRNCVANIADFFGLKSNTIRISTDWVHLGAFEVQFVFIDGDIGIFIRCVKYAFGLVIYDLFFSKNESHKNMCQFYWNMMIFCLCMRLL